MITFQKASLDYREPILQWLEEPHVKEFWDNSLQHREDILIFMEGRTEPSPYWDGIFDYWVGLIDNEPFCLLMTSEILPAQPDLTEVWKAHLSKTGRTFSIDFMIGNTKYLGRGLGGPTLEAFTLFINQDKSIDTFLIDPADTNPRAKHVYEKGGFKTVATFFRDSKKHFLMVKNMKSKPIVIGISGISGAGKSTLIKKLAKTLQATSIFWDEYDEISQGPQDYVKWFQSGKNYDDWIYTDLENTLKALKSNQTVTCPATKRELKPTKYILFDAPLGYCHRGTGKYIDFLVCLDTPPDIALARRLIRDYRHHSDSQKIVAELEKYLFQFRPLFILSPEQRVCDLIIDGSMSEETQEQEVLRALSIE